MHVVVQISTTFFLDDDKELLANLPINLGAADLYHALETINATITRRKKLSKEVAPNVVLRHNDSAATQQHEGRRGKGCGVGYLVRTQ